MTISGAGFEGINQISKGIQGNLLAAFKYGPSVPVHPGSNGDEKHFPLFRGRDGGLASSMQTNCLRGLPIGRVG